MCQEKRGGRGLANIEDCVDTAIRALDEYTNNSKERLIAAAKKSICNTVTNRNTSKNKKQKWEEKQLHGYFKRQTQEISHQKTWTWLRKGNLKRETESLIIAAQDNAIRTNYIKAKIDKTQRNSKCRMCGDKDETINHIISECNKLAQREYKTRHD